MSTTQIQKGKEGEREIANLLSQELGIELKRNLNQSRDGGIDLQGLDGWALEVKRVDDPRVKGWWQKLIDHYHATGDRPALFYRQDRRPWRVVLALRHAVPGFENAPLHMTIETTPDVFAALVREQHHAAGRSSVRDPKPRQQDSGLHQ